MGMFQTYRREFAESPGDSCRFP